MAANVGRWWKYAQAKLNSAVASGDQELSRLEAEREAELADKPWLASEGPAPTLDEAKARIEWEADEQRRRSEAAPPTPPTAPVPDGTDAEVSAARMELDRRDQEAQARLDAIRAELGVQRPPPGDA